MKTTLLGGLTHTAFLRKHWQKKPLLIRNAIPQFEGLLDKNKLISLSYNEDVQSRLVMSNKKEWQLLNGPFAPRDFKKISGNWTLLVQGINYFLPSAARLLKSFNFIPHARLDDLMVSYAPDGGGVGPHFDSYDVFLLQGFGKRLWQISKQEDRSLVPDAPLRILKKFVPEEEWLLEAGDMLYLPPNYAHNGIAVGESMTYSIGFRALSHQEIVREFLHYLEDHYDLDGIYTDPDLMLTKHPAEISPLMIKKVASVLKKIRFNEKEMSDFLGKYLSEPKQNLYFDAPHAPLTKSQFLQQAKKKGICLDLKSQMLFTKATLYINGEATKFHPESKALLKQLANQREVILNTSDAATRDLLYGWYLDGYLDLMA
ncbi:MAG: cupin domain-containing protein [Gammaproteobacteria bacterium]|nr:cupin domain-containing protein [Gammaproteobacteria bacterium]